MNAVRRFLRRIDPELMIQESMYGFVMSLTFVTAAQLGIFHYNDRTGLILAILGMDFVWGSIDMYIFYRMDMMFLHRQSMTLKRLCRIDDKNSMRGELIEELDGTIFGLMDESTRNMAADLIIERGCHRDPQGFVREKHKYLFNAVTAALVTFATAVPVVVCLLLIEDNVTALFSASAISSVALFFIGYLMSPYENRALKSLTGLVTAVVSLLLTLFAALFGG